MYYRRDRGWQGVMQSLKQRGLCVDFLCRWDFVHTRCATLLGYFAHLSDHLFNNSYWVPTVLVWQSHLVFPPQLPCVGKTGFHLTLLMNRANAEAISQGLVGERTPPRQPLSHSLSPAEVGKWTQTSLPYASETLLWPVLQHRPGNLLG